MCANKHRMQHVGVLYSGWMILFSSTSLYGGFPREVTTTFMRRIGRGSWPLAASLSDELSEKCGKGHSDHEWNDMADALADDGRRGKIQATAGRAVD